MSRYLFGCAAAAVLAMASSLGAQQYPPQTQPTTRNPTAQEPAQKVTVEGCLVREEDVPGRKPDVAERAGVLEDYILTDAKIIKGSAPGTRTGEAKPGETPAGTTGTRPMMYEVQGIDDEQLKKHGGRRVQIEGTFENVDRAQARPETQTPPDDLVQLRGTVIRQVSGECPPKKK
jgi:hypothetical protein